MLSIIIQMVVIGFIVIALIFFSGSRLLSTLFGAPFIDTDSNLVDAIIHLANPKSNDIFYDLGCGSGKIVSAFAKKKVHKSNGIEVSPLAYLMAKKRCSGLSNAKIYLNSFNNIDLGNATIVYIYLFPQLVDQLTTKFKNELNSGTKVICQDFYIKNKTPIKIMKVGRHKLYLYKY